jgi:hypothetical protein
MPRSRRVLPTFIAMGAALVLVAAARSREDDSYPTYSDWPNPAAGGPASPSTRVQPDPVPMSVEGRARLRRLR